MAGIHERTGAVCQSCYKDATDEEVSAGQCSKCGGDIVDESEVI